jgi:hypothetical protein
MFMNYTLPAITLCLLISSTANAQDKVKKDKFVSKAHGFSLEFENDKADKGGVSETIAHFYLPAKNGFAANVGVMRQEYEQSIDKYDELTKMQLKNANITMLKNTKTKDTLVYEYSGLMRGQKLHFLQKAIKRGKYIYLITATSLAAEWAANKACLEGAVDSFKLDNVTATKKAKHPH